MASALRRHVSKALHLRYSSIENIASNPERILTSQAVEIPTFDFCKRCRVCRCLAKAASARSCPSKSPKVEEKSKISKAHR